MNLLLKEILTSTWLLHDDRKDAYAAMLLSLLNGNRIESDDDGEDKSEGRKRNRSYVINRSGVYGADKTVGVYGLREDAIPAGSIAVIPIRDEIMKYDQMCGPRGTMSILDDLKLAQENMNIKSILLVVDSPGGQVSYTDILSDAIRDCTKPVVAYVEGMAASAAMWIISGAGTIVASSDLDRIGSIGTMLYFADLQPYYEKEGVKFHEIYATKSNEKNKDINDVLKGNYDNYRKEVLDRINDKFHASIKANRPKVKPEALTGKIFFAQDAIAMGLADSIGTMEYALELCDGEHPEEIIVVNPNDHPEPEKQDPEDDSQNHETMKFTEKMKAIMAIVSGKDGEKSEEFTAEMAEQLNDRIEELTSRNASIESQFETERTARMQLEEQIASKDQEITTLNSALAETTEKLDAMSREDAGGESTAGKEKDKEAAGDDVVYGHDRLADQFLGK